MQIKTIAMMMAMGCTVAVLTGCGVPKDQFEAKVAELDKATKEIETLKGKNADLESLLNSEKSKLRNAHADLDKAAKRIATLKQAEATASSALADQKALVQNLKSKLAAAQSSLSSAQSQTEEAKSALATLQEEYAKLKKRFEALQKNMKALTAPPQVSAPQSVAPAAAESSTEKSALDVLNEMSNM